MGSSVCLNGVGFIKRAMRLLLTNSMQWCFSSLYEQSLARHNRERAATVVWIHSQLSFMSGCDRESDIEYDP